MIHRFITISSPIRQVLPALELCATLTLIQITIFQLPLPLPRASRFGPLPLVPRDSGPNRAVALLVTIHCPTPDLTTCTANTLGFEVVERGTNSITASGFRHPGILRTPGQLLSMLRRFPRLAETLKKRLSMTAMFSPPQKPLSDVTGPIEQGGIDSANIKPQRSRPHVDQCHQAEPDCEL